MKAQVRAVTGSSDRAMSTPGDGITARSQLLSVNLSIYLDFLRLGAALAVFVGHSGKFLFGRYQHGIYHFLFNQGGSAVAVFFVLSGFVISFVTSQKEKDWRNYFIARASRLYSVAWVAIAVTVIADLIGQHFNPAYYTEMNNVLHFYRAVTLESAGRLLSFTNELWFSHVVFGTDEPYWSLGFEVLYYVFFGLICFLPRNLRYFGIGLWLLVAGPKIALYLPLWLLGGLTFRFLQIKTMKLPKPWAAFCFVFSILAYLELWREVAWRVITMYQNGTIAQDALAFCFYTATGLLVSLNIVAFHSLEQNIRLSSIKVQRIIKGGAGASFTLYLVHQPLILMLAAIFPVITRHALPGAIAMIGILIFVLLLAEIGERRKRIFSTSIRRLLSFMVPGGSNT
jgi:peptidoglycan/LPS O-acetylase OafA/YrhL